MRSLPGWLVEGRSMAEQVGRLAELAAVDNRVATQPKPPMGGEQP